MLYRALLRLYPAPFRDEYGSELEAVLGQRLRAARTPLARALLGAEAALDVLLTAPAVHADLLRQDLRYAWRTFRRSPGFAITAILVVALGVGANTAIFSVTDHVLLRPLPFAEPDRLVKIWESHPRQGFPRDEPSPANFRDWQRTATSFEAMGAIRGLSVNLAGEGPPERLDGACFTAGVLRILGVSPLIGRAFSAADDAPRAPGTVLLSYGLWQRSFGADPGVLGRKIILDTEPYTVIGVMPPRFFFPFRDSELWTPMRFAPRDFEDRNNNYLRVIARLKPGVSVAQAGAEIHVIASALERQYPVENAGVGAEVAGTLRDEVNGGWRTLLLALVGASMCVLLIACTNLANLLLARAMSRRRELAVRISLGAGRERLIRQLLTESMVISAAGGLLGIGLAAAGIPALAQLVPTWLPIAALPPLDWRMLGSAFALTVATGLGFGVLPAWRAASGAGDLRDTARQGGNSRRDHLRSSFVIAEITVSLVLLIASGLLVRALLRLEALDPGFRTASVLRLRTSLTMPRYETVASRERFYARVLPAVRALPGVISASYISFLPMAFRGGVLPVRLDGWTEVESQRHLASLRFVTPGLFETLGIPLLQGRDVSEADSGEARMVAVVSESFARHFFAGQDPIGRRFRFAEEERIIAGVVGNVRTRGLERTAEPQVYLPYKQVPDGAFTWYAPKELVIRATANPAPLAAAVRRIVSAADPQQPVSDVGMLSEVVDAETAPRRTQIRILGAFAAIAFLLAAVGIHGLLSFTVSDRAREFGIRIALGARQSQILAIVLRHGMLMAAAGVALGTGLAYAAARAMQALLAGIEPADGAAFGAGIALALLMTLTGCVVPALRAIAVDPVTVIRSE